MSKTKAATPAAPKEDVVETAPAVPAETVVIENAAFEVVDNTDAPGVIETPAETSEVDLGNGMTQVNYV